MKTDPATIREIEKLFERFKDEIGHSTLKPNAQDTYIRYPNQFLRWIKDDFPIKGYVPKK